MSAMAAQDIGPEEKMPEPYPFGMETITRARDPEGRRRALAILERSQREREATGEEAPPGQT